MAVEEILLLLSARNTAQAVMRAAASDLDDLATAGDRVTAAQNRLAATDRQLALAQSELAIRMKEVAQAQAANVRGTTDVASAQLQAERAATALARAQDALARSNSELTSLGGDLAAAAEATSVAQLSETAATLRLAEARRALTENKRNAAQADKVYADAVRVQNGLAAEEIALNEKLIRQQTELDALRRRTAGAATTAGIEDLRNQNIQTLYSSGAINPKTSLPRVGLVESAASQVRADQAQLRYEALNRQVADQLAAISVTTARQAALPAEQVVAGNRVANAFTAIPGPDRDPQAAAAAVATARAAEARAILQVAEAERAESEVGSKIIDQGARLALAEQNVANQADAESLALDKLRLVTAKAAEENLGLLRTEQALARQQETTALLTSRKGVQTTQVAQAEGAGTAALGDLAGGALFFGGLAAGALAVDAAKKAASFNQTLTDTIATTTQATDSFQYLKDQILGMVDGVNRFSPQQIEQALYPILSAPAFRDPANAANALKTVIAQAQPSGPDSINPIAKADVTTFDAFKLPVEQFAHVADVILKGTQVGGAQPIDFAKGIGTFSASAKAAGVSLEDAVGAFANATLINPRYRYDAQQLNRLFVDINKVQSPNEQRIQKDLGVDTLFGPQGVERAGGFAKWLQALQEATQGPNQQAILQALFTNVSSLTAARGVLGGQTLFTSDPNAARAAGSFASAQYAIFQTENAQGTTKKAKDIADAGAQARFEAVRATFDKQVQGLGDAVLTLTPEMVDLATGVLAVTQSLGNLGSGLGSIIDAAAHGLDLRDKFDAAGHFLFPPAPTVKPTDLIQPGTPTGTGLAGFVNTAAAQSAREATAATTPQPIVRPTRRPEILTGNQQAVLPSNGIVTLERGQRVPAGFIVLGEQRNQDGTTLVHLERDPSAFPSAPPARAPTPTRVTAPPVKAGTVPVADTRVPQLFLAPPPTRLVGSSPGTFSPSESTAPYVQLPPVDLLSVQREARIGQENDQETARRNARQAAALLISNKAKRDPALTDLQADLQTEQINNASDTQILKTRDAIRGVIKDDLAAGVGTYDKDTAGLVLAQLNRNVDDFLSGRRLNAQGEAAQLAQTAAAERVNVDQQKGLATPLPEILAAIHGNLQAQLLVTQAQDTPTSGKHAFHLNKEKFTRDSGVLDRAAEDLTTKTKQAYASAGASLDEQIASTSLAHAESTGNTASALFDIQQERKARIAQARISDVGKLAGQLPADIAAINATSAQETNKVLSSATGLGVQAAQLAVQRAQGGTPASQLAAAKQLEEATKIQDRTITNTRARTLADQGASATFDATQQQILVGVANQQVQAAQIQLQAAGIGARTADAQLVAATAVERAQIQADKTIFKNDPLGRKLADSAAQTSLAQTAFNTRVQDANTKLADLQATRQFDINTGQNTDAINKQIHNTLVANAKILGLTPDAIANADFNNRNAAIPRLAPTFAGIGGDPGLSAGRGQAQFRFGTFSDSTNQTITLLRQQVEQLQQELAVARKSDGHLENIDKHLSPVSAGGGVISTRHHTHATHGGHRGSHAQGVR